MGLILNDWKHLLRTETSQNLKGILKAYLRLISSLMKSESNFGKLPIKYKIELRLILFFTCGTQNIWCIAHSVYYRV